MPLPFIIGGIAAAAILGTAAYFSDDFLNYFKGKTIAILGSRNVGKSTMFDFFQHQKVDLNKAYEQTTSNRHMQQSSISVGDEKIRFSVNYDVGGGRLSYGEWKERIEVSDYIFYLVDASKVVNKDKEHIGTIKRDMDAIAKIIREASGGSKKKVFLVGNKSDKSPVYKSDFGKFENLFLDSSTIKHAILSMGGNSKCKVIVGSMSSNSEAEKMMKRLFNT